MSPSCSTKPTLSTVSSASSAPSPAVSANTVSNKGLMRPRSRLRSSTGKSLCDSSSDSARSVSSSIARQECGSVVIRQSNGERPSMAAYPVQTSRSPDSAASTLACAVSSTELNGTANSSASRRNAATTSSGILASCSPTPGTGSRVHRGSAVNPPARSTPPQNSRPRSAVVTVSRPRRLMLVISHLPGRVSPPPRVCWDFLSLHEKGVGGEHRAITHRRAVVDDCADPDRAAGAKRAAVGFESAVLQRMALDLAPLIEDAVVPDGGESPLRDLDAVVENALADPNTHQPPDHVFERGAVEGVEILQCRHLPKALVQPVVRVVDRANCGLQRAKSREAALHQRVVQRADQKAERKKCSHSHICKRAVKIEGGEVEYRDQEDAQRPGEEENTDGPNVVPVLCGKAAAELVARPEMVETAVTVNRSRNLEARRAEQADSFANLPAERNHRLCREQAVIARSASRGISDVVAHEVVWPDRRSGHAKGRARDFVIDHHQPVGDHRSGADRTQVRVRLQHDEAEVRPGLLDRGQLVPQAAQVVDDVGAVTEETHKELDSGHPRDHPVHSVVEAIQRIDRVRFEKQVQYPRDSNNQQRGDEHDAEEEEKRDHERANQEPLQRRDTGTRSHARIQNLAQRRRHGRENLQTPLDERQVQEEDKEQREGAEAGPTQRTAGSRRDSQIVHLRALCWRAVPPLAVRYCLAAVQCGGVTELGPIADRRVDVEHGLLADKTSQPRVTA